MFIHIPAPPPIPLPLQSCKDCWQAGIELSLWHMNRVGRGDFQPAKFYLKLLQVVSLAPGRPRNRSCPGAPTRAP